MVLPMVYTCVRVVGEGFVCLWRRRRVCVSFFADGRAAGVAAAL